MINYATGDAINPKCDGFKIITHCVGFFGIGFSKVLNETYPIVKEKYLKWLNNDISIGELFIVPIRKDLYIANLVGQNELTKNNYCGLFKAMKMLDSWLKSFIEVKYFISIKREVEKISIHYPMLGLAQDNWEVIEPLMSAAWKDFDIYVYNFKCLNIL